MIITQKLQFWVKFHQKQSCLESLTEASEANPCVLSVHEDMGEHVIGVFIPVEAVKPADEKPPIGC